MNGLAASVKNFCLPTAVWLELMLQTRPNQTMHIPARSSLVEVHLFLCINECLDSNNLSFGTIVELKICFRKDFFITKINPILPHLCYTTHLKSPIRASLKDDKGNPKLGQGHPTSHPLIFFLASISNVHIE